MSDGRGDSFPARSKTIRLTMSAIWGTCKKTLLGDCAVPSADLFPRGGESTMRSWRMLLCAAAWLLTTGASDGKHWVEARSDHFRLVINETDANARSFAERLERFDRALRRLYAAADKPDLHHRPVTIYALDPDTFLQACGCHGRAGQYSTLLSGPMIVTATALETDRADRVGDMNSQSVMLHEYSHHFMRTSFPGAYPFWFMEGFAEFNANVMFDPNGSVRLGYPANYRGWSLRNGGDLPMRSLLAPETYGYRDGDLMYGRAWLLTHYLMIDPVRRTQISTYLAALAAGKSSLVAATQAFGDLKALDQALDRYMRGKLANLPIPATGGKINIDLRVLGPGEALIVPRWVSIAQGDDDISGMAYDASRAEAAVRRYPDEPLAMELAGEVEMLAGRFDRAIEFADHALALRPDWAAALLLRGKGTLSKAIAAAPADKSAWTSGRPWFVRANHADPQSAETFYWFYMSYFRAGINPPEGAVLGLKRAAVLAPESNPIALAVSRELLREGEAATARAELVPIAYAPHRSKDANKPAEAIRLIDANKPGDAAMLIEQMELGASEDGVRPGFFRPPLAR